MCVQSIQLLASQLDSVDLSSLDATALQGIRRLQVWHSQPHPYVCYQYCSLTACQHQTYESGTSSFISVLGHQRAQSKMPLDANWIDLRPIRAKGHVTRQWKPSWLFMRKSLKSAPIGPSSWYQNHPHIRCMFMMIGNLSEREGARFLCQIT